MRTFVCFCLFFVMMAMSVGAATYSCRDSEGRLYITDNLQALPEDCRAVADKMDFDDPDKLNYVPQQDLDSKVKKKFEQQVRDEEVRLDQERKQAVNFMRQAEQAAALYQQAVVEKRQALRRWSYQSRELISRADQQIEKTRADKRQLLDDMGDQRLDREQARRILFELEKIEDQ